ncbi:MAG: 23S rRNA (adenine(2503)-C(2))-methyltransferase RlmN [Desulfobulbaceae bacterium]|nr:23S rRNA (adenine(2503)-C(2))-methyltransferase RlmN [Desulfobulbaceae bacterium]
MNNLTKPVDLKNFDQEQLITYVESIGQPAFRGRQIFAWLYKEDITDFSQMTDLAKEFRAILAEHAIFSSFSDPITEISKDGTVKFGFKLEDGNIIETVLIPEEDRNTLCVSSQVGCAMGCRFCLTGDMGFTRNLTPAEIVNQVCGVRDWIQIHGKGKLTNLVFMGMGEPLANFNNLITSLNILTNQRGLSFSSRRITVSTCGLPEKMIELGSLTDVNLAVSLHAIDDYTRSNLMPVNKKYPIQDLLAACKAFPMKKRQRIMFEYTLFSGINDSNKHAAKLAQILQDIPCKINLLAMNSSEGSEFKGPSRNRILEFQQILRSRGYTVFIRQSRGGDISAACGQLAGKTREKKAGNN